MASPNESPVGVYGNVLGIVNGPAAAEIVVLLNTFKTFLADPTSTAGDTAKSPDFMHLPPHVSSLLRAEIDAVAAAIAAAPIA